MKRRRRQQHDQAWHDARMAEGPQGWLRERGVTSWDGLHELAHDTTEYWQSMPRRDREAYAFPNPEDK